MVRIPLCSILSWLILIHVQANLFLAVWDRRYIPFGQGNNRRLDQPGGNEGLR